MIPLLLVGGGIAVLVALSISVIDRPVPQHKPDFDPAPSGSTGYKLVDAILPQLKQASEASGIPLGLLVGWIAKESGGKLHEVTKLDERGYFQLTPAESKKIGFDHQRLSTDSNYSINAGLAIIGYYMGYADKLSIARKGTDYYWLLVKLIHTMGAGAVKTIVDAAEAAGAAKSWEDLEKYAMAHNEELLHSTKHSPLKWFPFVNKVMAVGAPFGFGASTLVGAGPAFPDIIDPLDCIAPSTVL